MEETWSRAGHQTAQRTEGMSGVFLWPCLSLAFNLAESPDLLILVSS